MSAVKVVLAETGDGSINEALEVFHLQACHQRGLFVEGSLNQASFLGLESQDALLNRPPDGKAIGGDHPLLPHTVGAVDRLSFDSGIPPRVEENDVIGGREIKAIAPLP